jgi:spore maturation protein A
MDMVMSWIFTALVAAALTASVFTGKGAELAAAIPKGAQAGMTLAISLGGSICLWTGVGKVMEKAGFTAYLSRLLSPVLKKVFPSTKQDAVLAGHLSANICANFLGMGNAATPMGILAAQRLAGKRNDGIACNELCRLIVLNTASIQLIPATVAAARASLGCQTPFDILPAVWVTSVCSAGVGLFAAFLLGRVWRK